MRTIHFAARPHWAGSGDGSRVYDLRSAHFRHRSPTSVSSMRAAGVARAQRSVSKCRGFRVGGRVKLLPLRTPYC